MNILTLIWRKQRGRFLFCVVFGLLNPAFNLALLTILGRYTTQMRRPPQSWWLFVSLIIGVVVTQFVCSMASETIAHDVAVDLRKRLTIVLTSATLRSLEEIGHDRLIRVFMHDVEGAASTVPVLINMARELCLIFGVFLVLLCLSPKLMGLIVAALVIGIAVFHPLRKRGLRLVRLRRETGNKAFAAFRNAVDGVKQMQSSTALREAMMSTLDQRNHDSVYYGMMAARMFAMATQSAVVLYFGVFLLMTYTRIDNRLSPAVTAIYVIATILIINPLLSMAHTAQQIGGGTIDLQSVSETIDILEAHQVVRVTKGRSKAEEFTGAIGAIRTLEFQNVFHTYQTADRGEFCLGPVNFFVESGEVMFVVGGNGSGKTTLVKLLTGLYSPNSGQVFVNGHILEDAVRTQLVQQFSAVFNDACLFESLSGTPFDGELSRQAAPQLQRLRLSHAIAGQESLLRQASSCSSGERKRVAFLLAAMEERPMYVFDEFAADQDPACKELFYREVIPDLKRRGKIVIVVTHDDRYFSEADQILELERGVAPRVRKHPYSDCFPGNPAAGREAGGGMSARSEVGAASGQ